MNLSLFFYVKRLLLCFFSVLGFAVYANGQGISVPPLPNVEGECYVTVTPPLAMAEDGTQIIGTTPQSLSYSKQGTYVVIWKFEDSNGNVITANQNAVVKDTQAPIKPVLPDVVGRCSVELTPPTAMDNCAGVVVGKTDAPLAYTEQGTYIVSWIFDDGNGNATTADQKVIVSADQPMAVPILADVIAECEVTVAAPVATDICSGTVIGKTNDPVTYSKQGRYTIVWTFDDNQGNIITASQNVIVKDNTPPMAPVLPDLVAECSATALIPTAVDACAGIIQGKTTDPISYHKPGSYVVTWKFDDGNGNTSSAVQRIIVKDTKAPIVPVLADILGECTATASVPVAEDACGGSIIGITSDPITYTTQGTHLINWKFNDGNGNISAAVQRVIIREQSAPVVPVLPDVIGECSATVSIPEAKNACGELVKGITNNPLTYTVQGTHIVTWRFEDKNGNFVFADQKVIIKDNTAPVVPVLLDVIGECSVTILVPVAQDACSGTVYGTTMQPLVYSSVGEYFITWNFNDGNGNVATAVQRVVVKSSASPIIASLPDIFGECSASVPVPKAVDACMGEIVGTTSDPLHYDMQGTHFIKWTFDNGNRNITTSVQKVIIKDNTAPVVPVIPDIFGECSATVTAVPTAEDACMGKIEGTTTNPLTYTTQGTHIITWKFDDGNGNSSYVNQKVVLKDITPPAVPVLPEISGECKVTVPVPQTTDVCGGTILGKTKDPLVYETQGTHVITWTFDDGNGNSSTAVQYALVKDMMPPAAPALEDVIGECSASITIVPTAEDACGGKIVGTTSDPLTYTTQGTHFAVWLFDDGNGNISTATQTVIIKDNTPPAAPVLEDIYAECLVTVPVPVAQDACSGTVMGTTTDPLTYTAQGTFTVNWKFEDENGNHIIVPQRIIIKDQTAPVPPVLEDITGECSASITIVPMAEDACGGKIVGKTANPLTYTAQGTHIVTWTFDDGNGNVSQTTQRVIIKDQTAPVVSVLEDVTGECSVTLYPPSAQDACMGEIKGITNDPLTYTVQGVHIITWVFDDGNGNISTATQKAIIKDKTAPVVPSMPILTGECSVTAVAPVAQDACMGTIVGTTLDPLTYSEQGEFEITWKFDDGNGNVSTSVQKVVVKDTKAPVVPSLPDLTGECSVTVVPPSAIDVCSQGVILGTTTDPLIYNNQGVFKITWKFDDGNGNVSTAIQNVIVKDITPPVAPVLSDVTGECSASVTVPVAQDACMGEIRGTTKDPLTYTVQGVHVVTWTFDDGNGNSSKTTQRVVIKDRTAPVPPALEDLIGECSVTVPVPVAIDACSGNVNGITTDPMTYASQGSYAVTWKFDDGNGNVSTAVQKVIVKDTKAPVPPVLEDVTAECSVSLKVPSALDACMGSIEGTTDAPLNYTAQGTYNVTWKFDDGNGNVSTAVQRVIIKDTAPPVPPLLPEIMGECTATVPIPVAVDACKGSIAGVTQDATKYTTQGTHIITWKFDDGNGNVSTAEQRVVVKDITSPVMPILEDIYGECIVAAPIPFTTDICGGRIKGTTAHPVAYTTQGVHTIVWKFDDGNGNYTTATQNVIVKDRTAPVPPVLEDITAECSATVTPPKAKDACMGEITGTTTDPMFYSEQGTYAIKWKFDDGNGNVSYASQTVIIKDTVPPVVPALQDIMAECSAMVLPPKAQDACMGEVIGTTTDPLTYNKPGTYVIKWKFDDGNGNITYADQKVIVKNSTPISIPAMQDVIGECSVTVVAPVAVDACTGIVYGKTTDPIVYTGQGEYIINWTFDDGYGNTASSAKQKVVIKDTTPPAVPVLDDVLASCSARVNPPVAMDNCSGLITAVTTDPLTYTTQGTHLITWTFKDAAGNASVATQRVIIKDDVIPEVPALADVTGECSVSIIPPVAKDNCGGPVRVTTTDPLFYNAVGTHIIRWTFDDGNGNITFAAQRAIVTDKQAPVAPVLDDLYGECSVTVRPPMAEDACAGKIIGKTDDPLTYTKQGIYTIKWKFDDGNGNVSYASQSVTVKDKTPPPVPMLDKIEGECSVEITQIPTVNDFCSGIIKGITKDPLKYNKPGVYSIHWRFKDDAGNESVAVQKVEVKDTKAPVPPSLSDVVTLCSATVKAPTAKDACMGNITGTTSDPLTYDIKGEYTITWTFDDGNGNISTAPQKVIVKGADASVSDLLLPLEGECSVTVPVPSANACGEFKITTSDPLTYDKQGTYNVNWKVDNGNNIYEVLQTVTVKDRTAPVPPALPDVVAECSVTVPVPVAYDACVGEVKGKTIDPITYDAQGVYSVRWKFDDGNGNVSSAVQRVIVKDTQLPAPSILSDIVAQCGIELIPPSAIDACEGVITGRTPDPISYNKQGSYSVRWIFDDRNGNESVALQRIIIKDTEPPVVPNLPDVVGACSVTAVPPKAYDACMGEIIGTTSDPLTYAKQGTYVIKWKFDDGNGNVATALQNVLVKNRELPVVLVLGDIIGECSATVPVPTTKDACNGIVTGKTADPLMYAKTGIYFVNWKFDDGNGNVATAVQKVIITDKTAPVVPVLQDIVAECSAVVPVPFATDNCNGQVRGTTTDALEYAQQGVFTVNWKFEDQSGNSSYAAQKVIIKDTQPPVVPNLADVVGECVATVTIPSAIDVCMGPIKGVTSDPLTYDKQGVYSINWKFNDGNGNVATAVQKVIVNDTQPPAIPILEDVIGECSVTVPVPSNTDACAGKLIGRTTDPLTYTTQGTHIVTWKFEDDNGNVTTARQRVIVRDVTPPVAPVLQDVVGQCSVTLTPPSATDACSGKIIGKTEDALSYTVQGVHVVTWKFDDGNGNVSYASQRVIIQDTEPPLKPNLATFYGECSATVPTPTATDACAGIITGKTADPLVYTVPGNYTVTWTFDDGNGNVSTAEQRVVVKDTQAPQVPVLENIEAECYAKVIAPQALDACNGSITGTTTDPLIYGKQGTFVITWKFDDGNGNISTATQKVIIKDTQPPVPPVLPDIIGQCSATAPVPVAFDDCAGQVYGQTTDPVSFTTQGVRVITWSFNDGHGNVSIAKQKVIVKDTEAPLAPVLLDLIAECEITVPIPTSADACIGTVQGRTSDPLHYASQGVHVVTWTFDDGNGNVSTATQKVTIKDTQLPVVPALPKITGECMAAVMPPLAIDACAGQIAGTTANPTVYNQKGTYFITWKFDDGNGNVATAVQEVEVTDTKAPETPTLADITGECTVTVPVPTATDVCMGQIKGKTTDPLVYNKVGTYIVTWKFDDGNGNSSEAKQNVIVRDTQPPVVPVLEDVRGECSATVTMIPTATDACMGQIKGKTSDPLHYATQGTHVITWLFDDSNSNVSTAEQRVLVSDKMAPVAPVLADVVGECSATVTMIPTATDACMGQIKGKTTDPLHYATQGTHIITWLFDDGNGNISTAEQNVVVSDKTAPVLPVLEDVIGECSITVPIPTALDACSGRIRGNTRQPLVYTEQGAHIITWVFDDGNGNSSTAQQNIIVKDTQAPIVPDLPDLTGNCSVEVPVPTAVDACAGKILGKTTQPLFYDTQGTHLVKWTFDDGNGNTAVGYQKVIVDDITPPTVPVLPDVVGECEVNLTAPITNDVCSGQITGKTSDALYYNEQGTYLVKWTFEDNNGNVSVAEQKVIVKSNVAPTVPKLSDVLGQCSATVPVPVATNNCGGIIKGFTLDPLVYHSQGHYTVNWTFDDGHGNVSTAVQRVIIDNKANPILPPLGDVYGECSVTVPVPITTDACGNSIIGTTLDSLVYDRQGIYTVTWKFADDYGNATTATQRVIVKDTQAPVAPALPDVVGTCSAVLTAPEAVDACMGKVIGTTNYPLYYDKQGVYAVVWKFADGNGNVSYASQQVIVKDEEPPVPPVLPVVYGECSASVETPVATDDCVGAVVGYTMDPTSFSRPGEYVIQWIFNDGNGNSSTAEQKVIVSSGLAPVINELPDVKGECSVTVVPPTAVQSCGMKVIMGVSSDPLTYNQQGTYLINWSFIDGYGQVSTAVQKVIVKDEKPPVVPVLPDLVGECSVSVVNVPVTLDACTGIVKGTTTDPLFYDKQGKYTVTWKFEDANGNVSIGIQNVIVKDTKAPKAPVLSDINALCSVTLQVPYAIDACNGNIPGKTASPLTLTQPGTHHVVWTFDDGHGNTAQATQKVTLKGQNTPVIPVLPDLTGECSVKVLPPVCEDGCGGFVTGKTSDPLFYSNQGRYIVHWEFDFGNEHVGVAQQNVIVKDEAAPVVPNLPEIRQKAPVLVPIPVATDACSGLVRGTTADTIHLKEEGIYPIEWTFDDGHGNVSKAVQTVTVLP